MSDNTFSNLNLDKEKLDLASVKTISDAKEIIQALETALRKTERKLNDERKARIYVTEQLDLEKNRTKVFGILRANTLKQLEIANEKAEGKFPKWILFLVDLDRKVRKFIWKNS